MRILAFLADTVYFKDIKSKRLEPGEIIEIRKKATFKGRINVRVTSDRPIMVSIAGPHVEQTEVRGAREYTFTVEPDTEFYIGVQNKRGIFVHPANVTLEVEMLGPRKAIEVYNKVKNMLSMLQEAPEFYEIQKENIKELLKEVTEIWNFIGSEGKSVVKELVKLTKKLEQQT